ncbi:hypothetical protein FQN49_007944 [Arthroderma sp. PD_2]|nr:hypothetical protein FQN49_007944 [Arthroderma sp. PD_2]
MGLFSNISEHAQAHNEVTNAPHKAALSHELIAGAAAYEAAKAYENRVQENGKAAVFLSDIREEEANNVLGKPDSHAKAKEILAGFAGAFIDRTVETKGLDFIDKEKAHRQAQEHAQQALAGEY